MRAAAASRARERETSEVRVGALARGRHPVRGWDATHHAIDTTQRLRL